MLSTCSPEIRMKPRVCGLMLISDLPLAVAPSADKCFTTRSVGFFRLKDSPRSMHFCPPSPHGSLMLPDLPELVRLFGETRWESSKRCTSGRTTASLCCSVDWCGGQRAANEPEPLILQSLEHIFRPRVAPSSQIHRFRPSCFFSANFPNIEDSRPIYARCPI